MIETKQERITPTRAREILLTNTNNRTIRRAKVASMVRQMREGLWNTSHQGIALDPQGNLLDGQHRLHAIVEANIPVTLAVSYGVPTESMKTMDCGTIRTVADRLPLLTDKESNRIAVALVTAYLKCTYGQGCGAFTADQVDNEFLDKTSAYEAIAGLFRRNNRRTGLSCASIGAALVVYHHLDPARGMNFAKHYFSGEGLSAGQPAYTLREVAMQRRLVGSHEQYWKAMAACIADAEGRALLTLYAASKDLYGNVYRRLALERKEKALKGCETRKKKKLQQGAPA